MELTEEYSIMEIWKNVTISKTDWDIINNYEHITQEILDPKGQGWHNYHFFHHVYNKGSKIAA